MKLAGFDVETWGLLPEYALQPHRLRTGGAWITCAAFAIPGVKEYSWRTPTVDRLRAMLKLCADRKYRIVGWNVSFDIAWLIALGLREEVYACNWLDAMLVYKHLTISPRYDDSTKVSYALKPTVALYLPHFAGYETGVNFGAESDEERRTLETYNLQDTLRTLDLAQLFLKQLQPHQLRAVLVEAACLPMVAETLVEGVYVDESAAVLLDGKLDAVRCASFAQLKLSDGTISPKLLASPTQLSDLLHRKWGLDSSHSTPTGALSTDREALQALALRDPRASLINDYREATNNRIKFVTNTLAALEYNGDGFVRPAFRVYATYTGRGTYSSTQGKGKGKVQIGIALHQWKRDPEFRKLILPPPGYKLVEWDFAGQEFRWMAVVSGDETMLSKCLPGEDAHSFMASVISGETYTDFMEALKAKTPGTKEKRQLGKVGNLSCQYRTSANTLMRVAAVQHKIQVSAAEAQHIHRSYAMTYPRVVDYWRKQCWLVKRQDYIENLAGRRVWLTPMHRRKQDSRWSFESTAINFPVQSMGADQKYAALLVLKDLLSKWGGRFYYELHDGLYAVIPEDKATQAVLNIKHVLSNLPYDKIYGLSFPIDFPVDAKIGDSWGTLKEISE